jgi:hypothetical protein
VWGRGNTLYYRDGQRVIAATWAVSSGAFVVTRRTPLFDDTYLHAVSPHANYDVSPVSGQLIFLRGVEDQQVVVVQHWLAEVRGRTAAKR